MMTSTDNPFISLQAELEHELQLRKARNDYYTYVQLSNLGFKPTRFHDYLCHAVQDFLEKDTGHAYDILLLSVPPQSGKSVSITETLPSWYLGKHPLHNVIVAGYSGDFVQRFGRRNIDKTRTFGQSVFGDAYQLADSPCNNNLYELANHKGGALFAGITGGITGNPGNLIIIDDPIKTRQEAYSPTTQEAIINEYLYSVKTRLAAGAHIIVIATRWHENDLIGWMEKNERNVTVINIPCECVDPEHDLLHRELGDALVPEIGKGKAWLKEFKESYLKAEGASAWNAMFQGQPVADGGNVFKKEWFKYYTDESEIPTTGQNIKAISVDASFKEGDNNDFCSIQVWLKCDEDYYLLDKIKRRMGFVDTLAAIRSLINKYDDYDYIYIEDKANGAALIDSLTREFEGVVPVNPSGGKMSRAMAVTYLFENGHVRLPRYAAWLDDYLSEMCGFPVRAHDDDVDATTQALNRLADVEAKTLIKRRIKTRTYPDDLLEDYDNASPEVQIEMETLFGYPAQYYSEEETDG